jgi:hypothetical protein
LKEPTIFSTMIPGGYLMGITPKIDEKIIKKTVWYFTQGSALGSGVFPK